MTEPIQPKPPIAGQINDHLPPAGIDAEQSAPVTDEIDEWPKLADHEHRILRAFVMPYKQMRPGLSAGWCSRYCDITVDEATIALRNLLFYKLVAISNRRNMSETCYALTEKGFAHIQNQTVP